MLLEASGLGSVENAGAGSYGQDGVVWVFNALL